MIVFPKVFHRQKSAFFAILTSILSSASQIATSETIGNQRLSEENSRSAAASVNWKELFAKIFAANIAADLNNYGQNELTSEVIRRSIYFSQQSNTAILDLVRSAPTTNEAYERFRNAFEVFPKGPLLPIPGISNSANIAVPAGPAGQLAAAIMDGRTQKTRLTEAGTYNFFDTPGGQLVNRLMGDFILVVVPGYASHTQPLYSFIDIVEDANQFYGRPRSDDPASPYHVDGFEYAFQRPRRQVSGGSGLPTSEFMPPDEFHAQASATRVGFDVVCPMGMEMGDSLGPNDAMAEKLGPWLADLLENERYRGQDRKLILLGYSKGAPIIHEVTRWAKAHANEPRYARLHRSIKYLVTSNGVMQGAIPATNGFKVLQRELNLLSPGQPVHSDAEVIQRIGELVRSTNVTEKLQILALISKTGGFAALASDNPIIARTLSRYGIDPGAITGQSLENFAADKVENLLQGIQSMTAIEMVKWMLENMHDDNFGGKTIFNLSGITDVKDFLLPFGNREHPNGFDEFGPIYPPTIAPQFFSRDGQVAIDWPRFSLDNVFLHLTSMSGFEESPGGLFDAQVGWLDTKSMALDHRPLADSLNDDDLKLLGLYPGNQARSQLIDRAKNVSFVDLGDLRSTHWDISFRQAFVPPQALRKATEGKFYVHRYPRRAYHASIVETVAMYHWLSGGQSVKN